MCVLGLAVACTASVGPQASPSLRPSVAPAGWTVVTKTEVKEIFGAGVSKTSAGFRIAIPPTWMETDLGPDSVAAGDLSLAAANSTYASAVEKQQTGKPGQPPLAFSAVDPESTVVAGIMTTTLYVTGQHAERFIAASTMARSMQRYREQTVGADLWYSGYSVVDGRDAARLQMTYELRSATGERTTVASVQYIIVRDMDVFIIEFTGAFDEMDELIPVFESIAATFKIL